LITFTVTGILVGWVFRVKPFNDGENTGLSGRVVSLQPMCPCRGCFLTLRIKIQFEVALISVDPAAGTMVLDWSIINDTCRSNPVSICGDVDIFFDTCGRRRFLLVVLLMITCLQKFVEGYR
jgi:hypothetical protein